jgi:hypothetical protein
MENRIKDMIVGPVPIIGSTTINHAMRIHLGMNCSEYVLMDYIYRCVKANRGMEITEVYQQTGFDEQSQGALLRGLVTKGFVFPEQTNPPSISAKWESGFKDIEKEFEELFWKKEGKVFFTGSKKKSLVLYKNFRKKYSKDFAIKQRDAYCYYLTMERKRGFDRAVMMCERWLNPANEYYLVDWQQMGDEIKKKISSGEAKNVKSTEKPVKTETITEEERQKTYEQDSNQ